MAQLRNGSMAQWGLMNGSVAECLDGVGLLLSWNKL